MQWKLLAVSVSGVGLLAFAYAAQYAATAASQTPELWFQNSSYLTQDDRVDEAKRRIDKAAAAGYTGILMWDSSFNQMGNKDWDGDNADRMKEVMRYARKRHLKVIAEAAPYGWSNDVLAVNPNWAEAQRVVGQIFQVSADGKTLVLQQSVPGLVNGGFEDGEKGWTNMGDTHESVTASGRSGKNALTIVNPPGNARMRQQMDVKPWRQYHLSFSFKSAGANIGAPMVLVLDGTNGDKVRLGINLHESNEWKSYDYLINSRDSTSLAVYVGVWGGAQATEQFDDVVLEETGLVWVAHRDGAPFTVYDPADRSKVYQAGRDYNDFVDPDMKPHRPAFHNLFHYVPPFTLPATTTLKPGQRVAIDYYAATPLPHENQVGMCMTDAGVFNWVNQNSRAIKKVLPAESELLLYYDEIRHGNSCANCRAKNMTAGELLAWNFGQVHQIFQQTMPGTPLWVWNDDFDPYHNAHDNVEQVEGTLAGSWKGVPADVAIMNWNLDHLKQSLTWFSGLNPEQPVAHQQMIAGFYEKADAGGEARRELREAAGIPGIRGVMYTTWENNYGKLQEFADGVRAGWPDYVNSLSKH